MPLSAFQRLRRSTPGPDSCLLVAASRVATPGACCRRRLGGWGRICCQPISPHIYSFESFHLFERKQTSFHTKAALGYNGMAPPPQTQGNWSFAQARTLTGWRSLIRPQNLFASLLVARSPPAHGCTHSFNPVWPPGGLWVVGGVFFETSPLVPVSDSMTAAPDVLPRGLRISRELQCIPTLRMLSSSPQAEAGAEPMARLLEVFECGSLT